VLRSPKACSHISAQYAQRPQTSLSQRGSRDGGGLLSFVSYSLASYSPSQAIFDWTYDLWVTSSPNLTNGPQRGDLQVMIWYYYHDHLPSGSMVTLTTLPIWVNGSEVNTPFQVWMGNQGMN